MADLEIDIDTIVVKTAAEWAVDVTVYINRQILVTSDVFWGTTNQRKFKIADGVQTWINLDYPPFNVSAYTLAQVLASGALTNGVAITGNNGQHALTLNDNDAKISSIVGDLYGTVRTDQDLATMTAGDDNTTSSTVTVSSVQAHVTSDNLVNLDAPSVRLTQETASRIAILDASKDIIGADTATYPSLTELTYLKGATSSIQTQINAKTALEIMVGSTTVFSPLDLTTTYIACLTTLAPNVSAALRPIEGINATVCGFWAYIDPTGVLGSNEEVVFNLYNITDATVVGELGRISFDKRGRSKWVKGLNLDMVDTKDYSVQMANPNWVTTNPTNVSVLCKLLIK